MMLPNVYSLLVASAEVTSYIDERIYRHGAAPQNVEAPYVTWFVASGTPENELDQAPRVDAYQVHVDCWSNNEGNGDEEIEGLAQAVRDAIESRYHMTGIVINGQDPETLRFRIGMLFTFWNHREQLS